MKVIVLDGERQLLDIVDLADGGLELIGYDRSVYGLQTKGVYNFR